MCVHCRRRVWYERWLLIECTRRRACHTLPCCALYYVTSILYYMSYSFYTRSLIYWCHILECHIPLIWPIDCFCMLVYTMYNHFNGYLQCTVSYAPFYVCNDMSAMTSIKYFKVKGKPLEGTTRPVEFTLSLTHWSRDKMDAISRTTFSSAFSWMKMFEFRLQFEWSLFPRVQLTIFQHWFR